MDSAASAGGLVRTPRALEFHLWLMSQAESNALEGENETADRLRDLAALVLEHPDEFEAYARLRAKGAI